MRRSLAALVLALVFSLSFVLVSRAQDDPKKEEDPAKAMAQAAAAIIRGEIDLRDDQVDKVQAVLEKGMTRLFEQMAARDRGEQVEDVDVREMILGGLNDILDEKQRAQLDALVKEFDTQSGRFESGTDDYDPDFDPSTVPSEKLAERAEIWLEGETPSVERLVLKADNALILSEDERKIVLPRIEAVVKARRAIKDASQGRRASLGIAVHAKAKEDEVRERLHELRHKLAALQKDLDKAEGALREVVTLEQEARLVALGILD